MSGFSRKLPWAIASLLCWTLTAGAAGLATTPVERVAVPDETVLDGLVEAVNQSTVAAQTSGRVTEVRFDVDDFVPKGEVLVQLRDTDQQAGMAKANSGLQDAQARYQKAADDLRRKQTLLKDQAVSQSAVDTASAEYKSAQAGLSAARAQVASAQEQVEHTLIRAPYSGIVVTRNVEPGETVQPGTTLMTGLSLDALRVSVQVPQGLVASLRQLQQASVLLPGTDHHRVAVQKLTISPRADADTHTFLVRLQLPALEQPLYPGMSVKVAITTGTTERLLVPEQALVHRSEVAGVYVVDTNGIHFRQVRPGRVYDGQRQEILAGLSAGEAVALDPVAAAIRLKSAQRSGPAHE
jgi:RND family efflux transporter MFP subunit